LRNLTASHPHDDPALPRVAYRLQVPPTAARWRWVAVWWKPSASAATGAGTCRTSSRSATPAGAGTPARLWHDPGRDHRSRDTADTAPPDPRLADQGVRAMPAPGGSARDVADGAPSIPFGARRPRKAERAEVVPNGGYRVSCDRWAV